jgi:natural product biosynthesis luciferase-like monooxygenase protein
MISTNAVFVGNGSLLIQCADAYTKAGHMVRAIASQNPAILQWAGDQGFECIVMESGDSLDFSGFEFDYLFSVANLEVLPAESITQARKLAINFHDALLPRYAGLNATSWALMAQELTHGVTWHEMLATVDSGRVVRQISFDIADGETALSLNARCYEAGLETFVSIVEDLGKGELLLKQQTGERSYFAKNRRPEMWATLDFRRAAGELVALVRALDFGQYPNPLSLPKIYLGESVRLVCSLRIAGKSSSSAPGTVVSVDGSLLRIATLDDDVLVETSNMGRESVMPAAVVAGFILPLLPETVQARLSGQFRQVAKGESFWLKEFADNTPVDLPYPRKNSPVRDTQSKRVRASLGLPFRGSETAAAFAAWLSALTGQSRISMIYCDDLLVEQASGLAPWLSSWVPLTLESPSDASPVKCVENAQFHIGRARQAGPYPHDLLARQGDHTAIKARVPNVGVCLSSAAMTEVGAEGLQVVLTVDASGQALELSVDESVYALETINLMASHVANFLGHFQTARSVAEVPLLPPAEMLAVNAMNATSAPFSSGVCMHEAIARQAALMPDHIAISWRGGDVSFQTLDKQVTALAARLIARGVNPGAIIGLCLERTPDLVVAMLAIMKTGAAYLPLDPEYPHDRIAFMVEDSASPLIVTSPDLAALMKLPSGKTFFLAGADDATVAEPASFPEVAPDQPAYVIYTSGSTGRPKGVIVKHQNVMNFFAGMSARVPHEPGGRWLAVTSLSFDISVLELCWTLACGLTVVLHSNAAAVSPAVAKSPDFSLFYFASDDSTEPADRYKLLLDGAKFADENGFSAIWTPERHFHAFGGLYPNPAVTSAAIAAMTSRVKIRAGSCVLPLHHPVRVAEDWAFVDNISKGRVGVSFASGWQPNDFVLAPAAFATRKTDMLSNIDVVRRLWRGEAVAFPGPHGKPVDIKTLPRPIQKELPIWLTAAGNPETFEQAGQMGCHLLTHLLGQKMADVSNKLRLYRAAWKKAGHEGVGHVTLMLHTFVGKDEDSVRDTVRGPMKEYLRSSVDLIKQAAWSFPTFVQRGAANGVSPVEIMDAEPLSAEDMDALLDHAFTRYYGTSALFGTPERCLDLVAQLKTAGVDEIACLIDFGIAPELVLEHLPDLKRLMDASKGVVSSVRASVADDIIDQTATHLQCTPSMASMLVADSAGREALSRLSALLVGGEALSLDLARQLRELVPGSLINMYGPTETTVWSTTCDLASVSEFVPLGQPIANTALGIRTVWGSECPALVPGELFIGGEGVTAGYLHRPELTSERFVEDSDRPGSFMYRTGDLVRRHPDGAIEFLGRMDNQVKIRGHRIELGEIEAALMRQTGVKEAVVVARDGVAGDKYLSAYLTPQAEVKPDLERMRSALAAELPDIMLPKTLMLMQAFPLTPNKKIDRRALPEANTSIAAPRPSAEAESQLEKEIASIWEQVLGVPKAGISDNFFDLGGHSLLVIQVQRRLREATGREISITDMFRLPTISALAAHLNGRLTRTAVSDGLNRANARRGMRLRVTPRQTPVA